MYTISTSSQCSKLAISLGLGLGDAGARVALTERYMPDACQWSNILKAGSWSVRTLYSGASQLIQSPQSCVMDVLCG